MRWLYRLFRHIRDWIDGDPTMRPARPRRRPPEVEHETWLRRLRDAWADGRTMTDADFEYWSDRYERLSIADTVGCSFNLYLNNPVLVEALRKDALKGRTLSSEASSPEQTDRCLTKSQA